MKYTQLGRTGLTVSRLFLGTMNFGPQTDEADQPRDHGRRARRGHQLLRHRQRLRLGREQGPHRGDHRQLVRQGRRAPRQGRPRHQGVREHGADGAPGPTTTSCPRSTSGARVDASLKRLQTDYIDLYQFHHIDRATPWEEIWQAIDVARPAGQDPLRRRQQLRRLADRPGQRDRRAARGIIGLVSEQCLYNLAERRAEMEVIPAAQEYGLGRHPLVAAARRSARRRDQEGGRGRAPAASGRAADALADAGVRDADPGVRGPARQARPGARRGSPWPGC